MKGKLKGKIFNFRNIIISLIIIIMAVTSGISIVQYNSRNVETNTNLSNNSNISEIASSSTNKTIVTKAIELANSPDRTYVQGCSEFVDTALYNAGIFKGAYKPTSNTWYNNLTAIKSYLNDGYKIEKVAEGSISEGTNWYSSISASLQPGDILVGRGTNIGHMAIYLGKANSLNEMKSKIKTLTGISVANYTVGGTKDGDWLVYCEGEGGKSKINAYGEIFTSAKNKKCTSLKIYRIDKNDINGSFNFRVNKEDMDKNTVNGSTFEIKVNGVSQTSIKDPNGYVFPKTFTQSGQTITYKVKETKAPTGYAIGYTNEITVTITSSKIDNKYVATKWAITGTGINSSGEFSQKSTTSESVIINNYIYVDYHGFNVNTAHAALTLHVKDPNESNVKGAAYTVNLRKIDSKTNKEVKGATFNVSYGYMNPAKNYYNRSERQDTMFHYDNSVSIGNCFSANKFNQKEATIQSLVSGSNIQNNNENGDKSLIAISSEDLGNGIKNNTQNKNYNGYWFTTHDYYSTRREGDTLYITDKYVIKENDNTKLGYKTDGETYIVKIEKIYSTEFNNKINGKGYNGLINSIAIETKSDGSEVKTNFKYGEKNGTYVINDTYGGTEIGDGIYAWGLSNLRWYAKSGSDGTVNFQIYLDNEPLNGEYSLNLSKLSLYNDNKVKDATFKIEQQIDGGNKNTQIVTTGDSDEIIKINTENITTDHFWIEETGSSSDHILGSVRKIWIDVYKKVENNAIVVDYLNVSFRDENERYRYNYNENGVSTDNDYASGLPGIYKLGANASKTVENGYVYYKSSDKTIYVKFRNPKDYNLQICKYDSNGNSITGLNIVFSINMYEEVKNTNGTIAFNKEHKIYTTEVDKTPTGRKNTQLTSLNTTDGVISSKQLYVDKTMTNKTFYYLITEDVQPDGYQNIGAILATIHFDNDGNASITKLEHLEKNENNTYKVIATSGSPNKGTVSVSAFNNDNLETTATVDNNFINFDIKDPEEKKYNIELEKQDANGQTVVTNTTASYQLKWYKYDGEDVSIENDKLKINTDKSLYNFKYTGDQGWIYDNSRNTKTENGKFKLSDERIMPKSTDVYKGVKVGECVKMKDITLWLNIEETGSPVDYKTTDNLLLQVHFDKEGNTSIIKMISYSKVKDSNEYYSIIASENTTESKGTILNKENETTKTSVSVNGETNTINLIVNEPEERHNNYKVFLEKRDSISDELLSDAKFEISDVTINSSNINNTNNKFSITTNANVTNINENIYNATTEDNKKIMDGRKDGITEKANSESIVVTKEYADTYKLKETQAALDHSICDITTLLQIKKTQDENGKYKAGSVVVKFNQTGNEYEKKIKNNQVAYMDDGGYCEVYEADVFKTKKNEILKINYNWIAVSNIDGCITVTYYNQQIGHYNLELNKLIKKSDGTTQNASDNNDIKFNVELLNSSNGKLKTLKDKTATEINNELYNMTIADEDISGESVYRWVIEESSTLSNLTVLNYKIVIPIKFETDENKKINVVSGDNKGAYLTDLNGNNKRYISDITDITDPNKPIVDVQNKKVTITAYNEEKKYNLSVDKYVIDKDGTCRQETSDDNIKFNLKLYEKMNNNLTFENEITELQKINEEGSINLTSLTNTWQINTYMRNILVKNNDIGKTCYYVLEETNADNSIVKLDYKIVIPIKFENSESVVKIADDNGAFIIKNNQKTYIKDMKDDETNPKIEIDGLDIKIKAYNKEKTGKYKIQVLKVNKNDYKTYTDINKAFTTNKDSLYKSAREDTTIYIQKTKINDTNIYSPIDSIETEAGKAKELYSSPVEIKNENFANDSKSGTETYLIKEVSTTSNFVLNNSKTNMIVELQSDDYKYSLVNAHVDGDNETIYKNNGVYINIDKSDEIPTVIIAIANDEKTGEYSFKLNKINYDTDKELTEEERAGMEFSFKLYKEGKSFDDPGTLVETLTKTDNSTVNISNLTTIDQINSAMSNIKISENDSVIYRLIIEETKAPKEFKLFGHKIGIMFLKNTTDEKYVMSISSIMVESNGTWQPINGTFNDQTQQIENDWTEKKLTYNYENNILTLTLPNTPKTGKYNLQVKKANISGNAIINEKTKFNVKMYKNEGIEQSNGSVGYLKKVNTDVGEKEYSDSYGITIKNIEIKEEDVGKTYYYMITEETPPDGFTKIDYKIMVPVTFSENENEYVATKGEPYALVEDTSLDQSGSINWYIKKKISDVATSTKDVVTTEQTDATINVNVPNKRKYTLKLKKTNASTGEGLANVGFNLIGAKINGTALKNANNQDVTKTTAEPITTDTNGTANICEQTSVPNPIYISTTDADEYYITETSVPGGFEKLPDDLAIKLQVNKSREGEISAVWLGIVNSSNIQDTKKLGSVGETSTVTDTLDSGSTVTISATISNNEVVLTVADPTENTSGEYNLYLEKRSNKNERLAGVNFELIDGLVNGAKITQNNEQISEKNPKTIITSDGRTKTDVYTNPINIENTTTDTFTLREKDLGNNKGYTQLPNDYKIKVEITKEKVGSEFRSTKATLKLLDESGNEVSKNDNDKYVINNVEYDIRIEKSGNVITIIVENPKVEGDYKLNVIKKNVKDTGNVTSFNSFGTNSIAGAKIKATVYKGTTVNNYNFNFWDSTNRVVFDEYTTKGTTEDLTHDNFKRTGITYFDIANKMLDIWDIEETDAPEGFENMKKSLVLGIEKAYNDTTKQFSISDIHIYKRDNSSIRWDAQSYTETNLADGSVIYEYVSDENDTWHIMLNKDRTQIAVAACNIPKGDYKLNIMKKDTTSESAGDVYNDSIANATFNTVLYKDIELNSADFKLGRRYNSGNYETFASRNGGSSNYVTKGTEEDLNNDIFKRENITTDSIGNKYDIWNISELMPPDGLQGYMTNLVLGVKKEYDTGSKKFKIKSITMYKNEDGTIAKDENGNWKAETVYNLYENGGMKTPVTEMTEHTTYVYFDKDNTRRWDLVIDSNNNKIIVTLHNDLEGSYNLNIVKKGAADSTVRLDGYKFAVKKATDGNAEKDLYTEESPLTTSHIAPSYVDFTRIHRESLNTPDVYTFTELDTPENSSYVKIPYKFKLTISKKIAKNDKGINQYLVDKMKLELIDENGNVVKQGTSDSDNKVVIESTLNGQTYSVIVELVNNTISITVINPEKSGQYSLNLRKLDEETKAVLDGAEFSVKLYNAMTYGTNEKTSVDVLKDDGSRETIDLTKIKTVKDFEKLKNIIIEDPSGITYHTWEIIETKAPEGYQKLNYSITINLMQADTTNGKTMSIIFTPNARYEDGTVKKLKDLDDDEVKTTVSANSDEDTNLTTVSIDMYNRKTEIEGQYDLNIKKVSKSGVELNNVEFSLMSAKINNAVVTNDKGESATDERFVTGSNGVANIPSLTSVPNPIKITDIENDDVYVFKETALSDYAKNKFVKLPDYVSIELTVKKASKEIDGKNQFVANGVSIKLIDNRDKKEYKGSRNNVINYSFSNGGDTYTATIRADITNNTITLTIENPENTPKGEYKLSLIKKGDNERLGGVKFNLISARFNGNTIQNGNSVVSESNPIEITTNAQKEVGIWPTDGSSLKIANVSSDEYILKEVDLGNNRKYVKLPDNKLIKLVVFKEQTNNEFKVSSINMYVGNDTDGWQSATYTFNEEHTMIIEAAITVTDNDGNEFALSFSRSGNNLTLTVEDPKEETTKYTVSKKWDDINSAESRPEYVVFRLFGFKKDDAEAQNIYRELNRDLENKAYGTLSNRIKEIGKYQYYYDINVRASDGWKDATWYNLSKDYNYFAWETNLTDGYEIKDAVVSADNTKLTITNYKAPTNYVVQKVWDDENVTGSRPTSVEFRLFRFNKENAETVKLYNELMGYVKDKNYSKISQRIKDTDIASLQHRQSIGVTAADNWTATFESLSSDYYYFAWEISDIDGYNITNAVISDDGAKISITNSEDSGRYKVFLMKKNVAEAKTAYGDDTRSALAGAEFSTKVYKNIRKNNMNFEFNNSFNEEDKGTYTTIGTDANGETDLIDANGIVRSGLKSNELNTGDMYDIWKIEETKSPDGFSLMTEPLVFGVKKKYDSTTKEFTIEDIFVYTKRSNGIASLGGAWTITPITNQNGNTANGINPVVENTTYTFEQNGNTWSIVLSKDKTKIILTAYDKKISKFNYKLIKKEQGSDKSLSGALFETTIKDEDGNPLRTSNGKEINKLQQRTSAEYGTIGIDDIEIDGEGKKYTVEITEVIAPAGYEKIMDTITFTVTSQLSSDGSYILTPGDYTAENTKECKVDENGDLIVTVEDKKTEKKEFAVYKEWGNVKDTELPDSITVELYRVPENELDRWNEFKNDKVKRQEYLYRGYLGSGGTVVLTKDNAITSDGLTWYYKWSNLAIENSSTNIKNIYYVIETEGPEGFITTMEPNDYTDPDVSSVTIKNTKPTTKYTIQKVWDENVQISAMPRTLLVSLYAFDKNNENDVKTYNDLVEYVNNKNYDEINKKLETLTDKKQGNSIGLTAGNQWSFTWNSLSTDNYYLAWESDSNALSKFNITNAVISDENTKMTITNTLPEGSFKFKLIKKLDKTNITLANAKFTVSIKDEDGNELIPDTSHEYKTDANGEINLNKLAITGANKEYTVTIKETEAPAGYVKLTDEVSFKVKSVAKADGSGYELAENDLTQIKNAKDAKVTAEGIEVTIYNDLTPPHKGVKDIKNQDSGYYDSVTGKVYANKDEAISTLHDWVIQTTIPEGITAYTTYEISDEINEKLVFAGLDTVKVKYVNGAELTKDKDYKVTYDEASRMLKVTFIDDNFKGGYNLEVGKDVEIRFNTTFALDSDGNIIAINEEVPNQAKLTYGNDVGSGIKLEKVTEIPEVHTGGVGIYKYDEKTKKALEGAHFKLATSKENAMAGVFVKDGNGNDIEKVTNSKGVAEFAGLEFGEDALNKAQYETIDSITGAKVYKYDTSKLSTTYYLVETESPKGYLKLEEPIEVVVKVGSYDMKDITSLVQVGNEEGIYDLSLRKFITNVKDTAKGTEEEVTSRIPQVDLTKLASGESTTATYTHPKDPVLVHTTDIVTYTIRIYNEGPQDAYASIVKDDIPDGLQFVQYTKGDGSLNDEYRWKLVDENDNEVTDVSKAKYIVTDYLSKEQDKTPGANLLKAYKADTMKELDYRDVKVQFKVIEPTTSDRILINYAQISKETDKEGTPVRDRDSTPNVWIEGEDDQDIEKVRVQYFDLSLRKWVTQAIVTENGKTVVTQTGHKAEDDPEEVVKVDLKKSKINDVVVKFRYSIRITNEGEIAGEATEIRDDIPQGLKFVAEDNPDWRVDADGKVVTNKLEHTTLQPGESAEVEILLTWVNSENNMGVMTNIAEINKDHNDYGTPDIDSTPGNNVPGEDDIDDAPVMLTVKTGSEYIIYTAIALSAIVIVAIGGKSIKKRVMKNI